MFLSCSFELLGLLHLLLHSQREVCVSLLQLSHCFTVAMQLLFVIAHHLLPKFLLLVGLPPHCLSLLPLPFQLTRGLQGYFLELQVAFPEGFHLLLVFFNHRFHFSLCLCHLFLQVFYLHAGFLVLQLETLVGRELELYLFELFYQSVLVGEQRADLGLLLFAFGLQGPYFAPSPFGLHVLPFQLCHSVPELFHLNLQSTGYLPLLLEFLGGVGVLLEQFLGLDALQLQFFQVLPLQLIVFVNEGFGKVVAGGLAFGDGVFGDRGLLQVVKFAVHHIDNFYYQREGDFRSWAYGERDINVCCWEGWDEIFPYFAGKQLTLKSAVCIQTNHLAISTISPYSFPSFDIITDHFQKHSRSCQYGRLECNPIMQSKRQQLVINLPSHHLVVQPSPERLTFFAYNATHQLSVVLTRTELSSIKWFTEEWFETPLEFYTHLKQHPEWLGIDTDSNELVLSAKIGQKEKSVGITMHVARLEGLKEIRIAQKKASFQLRQDSELTQQCQERIAAKQAELERLKEEYREESKLKQKAMRELVKSQRKTIDANSRFSEKEAELYELSAFHDLLYGKLALLEQTK